MPLHLPELLDKRGRVTAKEIYPTNQFFETRTFHDNADIRRKLKLQGKEHEGFKVYTSELFPNTEMITYKAPGSAIGHQINLTKFGNHYEYYNSTGKSPYELPKEIRNYVLRRDVSHGGEKHQGTAPTCVRHGITRACFENLPRAEYDKIVSAGMLKYGLSADAIVHGLTNKLIDLKPADLKALVKPEPPVSLKKGGIVKKSK